MKWKFALIIFWILFLFPVAWGEVLLQEDFSSLDRWSKVYGKWGIDSAGRLVQGESTYFITHLYTPVDQWGKMSYEFDVQYLKGLSDQYGGFGCHVLIDKPATGYSWGHNQSYLFWITYDTRAYKKDQFFFQIYESSGAVTMTMIHEGDKYPIDKDVFSPREFIEGKNKRIALTIDTATGMGQLSFPSSGKGIDFTIPDPIDRGAYFSFRANHLSLAFDNLLISRMEPSVLKELTLSGGTLSPSFNREIHEYTLEVAEGTEEVTLTSLVEGKVAVNARPLVSRSTTEIPLSKGMNVVQVSIGDQVYTLNISRPGSAPGEKTTQPMADNTTAENASQEEVSGSGDKASQPAADNTTAENASQEEVSGSGNKDTQPTADNTTAENVSQEEVSGSGNKDTQPAADNTTAENASQEEVSVNNDNIIFLENSSAVDEEAEDSGITGELSSGSNESPVTGGEVVPSGSRELQEKSSSDMGEI